MSGSAQKRLHKKCVREILRHLYLEGNEHAVLACDYCVEHASRSLDDIREY